jgi:hypothetical protein
MFGLIKIADNTTLAPIRLLIRIFKMAAVHRMVYPEKSFRAKTPRGYKLLAIKNDIT